MEVIQTLTGLDAVTRSYDSKGYKVMVVVVVESIRSIRTRNSSCGC
jgi:hypothetical protein